MALVCATSLPATAANPAGAANNPGAKVKPKTIDKPKVIKPKLGDKGWRTEDPLDDHPQV